MTLDVCCCRNENKRKTLKDTKRDDVVLLNCVFSLVLLSIGCPAERFVQHYEKFELRRHIKAYGFMVLFLNPFQNCCSILYEVLRT